MTNGKGDPTVAMKAAKSERGAKTVVPIDQGGKVPQPRKDFGRVAEPPRARALEVPAAAPWSATAQYAHALLQTRRRRSRRMLTWFSLIVLVPTIVTAVYFLFVATPRYTSQFEFTYQTYRGSQSLASGLVQSVTGTSQQNTIDLGTIVYEYLQSQSLIDQLDKTLDLRKHFSASNVDWWSRLPSDSSHERFLDYVRSHISATQGQGGFLSVKVTTFDRDFSLTLAKAVMTACDKMVDDLSVRARQNQVGYAESELARQEDRLRKARLALTQFQNQH